MHIILPVYSLLLVNSKCLRPYFFIKRLFYQEVIVYFSMECRREIGLKR